MTAASAPSPGPRSQRTRPNWRKVALATASVAINAGLIATLSLTALGIDAPPSAPDPRPLYIDISPRPLLPDERPRPAMQTPEPVTMSASRDAGAIDAAPTNRVASAPDSRPAPIRPRIAAPTPQGAPAPPDAWTVNPNDRAGAMSRVLRQGLIGCTTPQQLNAAERAHCREDAMRRGMNAAPITGTGNPERDAAFAREGARRLAEWEARRRPLSGGVGVVGPADCVGSNFGTGCAGALMPDVPGVDMRQGAETTINRGERRRQGFSASIGGLRVGGKD
ncbi:hypothetical protein [Brevundimonas diminuta]|uniref:hypothetical protein n=1 Tax=Brevundimonas diminuta TaxID=293 RepID=UPI001F57BA1E|nr:hypothetical protein [Brevundimonas diminuta]